MHVSPRMFHFMFLLGLLFVAACQTPAPVPESLDPSEVFKLSEVDEPPLIISQSPPFYPEHLRRDSETESAVIRFVVNAHGKVVNAVVIRTSYPAFGKASLQAASAWRYKPARKSGRPTNCVLEVPLFFSTKDF